MVKGWAVRSGLILAAARLLVACTAPEPSASCVDIARELADVLVESIDAQASEYAQDEVPSTDAPSLDPEGTPRDAFDTASALAGTAGAEAHFRDRIETLEQDAHARDCGEDAWANPLVIAALEADLKRRYDALDGEPTAEEYAALNTIASVLVVLEGRVTDTES